MRGSVSLQPTLWRTCRVLANRQRLRIFRFLLPRQAQTVSTVAQRLKLPLPVTSQYLRALEARGLLSARRVGRRVHYRASNGGTAPAESLSGLILALRSTLGRDARASEAIFKLATAFTHPRRIQIFRVLAKKSGSLDQLRLATGISVPALRRHLDKLRARGFVVGRLGIYAVVPQPDPIGRALALIAAE